MDVALMHGHGRSSRDINFVSRSISDRTDTSGCPASANIVSCRAQGWPDSVKREALTMRDVHSPVPPPRFSANTAGVGLGERRYRNKNEISFSSQTYDTKSLASYLSSWFPLQVKKLSCCWDSRSYCVWLHRVVLWYSDTVSLGLIGYIQQ